MFALALISAAALGCDNGPKCHEDGCGEGGAGGHHEGGAGGAGGTAGGSGGTGGN